jgi:hypothetical protein
MTMPREFAEGSSMGAGNEDNPPNKRGKSREFRPAGRSGDDPLTRNLKRVYDEVAAEPIPEDWLKLLDQLDAKAKGRADD